MTRLYVVFIMSTVFTLLVVACTSPGAAATKQAATHEAPRDENHRAENHNSQALPKLSPAPLADGEKLQVIATTSIIADVVAQVGGDHIELTGLLPIGADVHSYEAAPHDLVKLDAAHVIFINGLGLEEALMPIFDTLDNVPIISVNAGIEISEAIAEDDTANEHDHAHEGTDPHTWFSIHHVTQWVENIARLLADLDPANANAYETSAAAYLAELTVLAVELDELVATLPVAQRKLVTDHEALGYLAAAYDFEIVGAVIPTLSTLAAPSARELARLQDQIVEEGVSAIFVGVSANATVAEQVAQDMGIQVVPIYVASLSAADGPASSYLAFMRHTLTTIVEALR